MIPGSVCQLMNAYEKEPVQFAADFMENHWLPFTENRTFKSEPRLFVRAEGMYYWNETGRRVMDGVSGLFVAAAGHCRPEIATAVANQLLELDFAPSFLRSHPLAFQLANRIADQTPDGIDHVFFCGSGSEAVDSAMKIALAYHHARGDAGRTMFVSRERAYHGVNMGGTSLSGMVKNRETFGPGLPGIVHMRHTWSGERTFSMGQSETGAELADDLERMVLLYGAHKIAACFVEPIAGGTGVLVPPKGYLERLREICDAHGILLVFDEVICGFGRTGKALASESFGVTPDIITMAKALTNGAVPMGAVAVSDEVYKTVVTEAGDEGIELFHGYTFSAHPVACAAALAALDIYGREGLYDRAANLAPDFLSQIESLQEFPQVTDVRGYGMLAAFDLASLGKPGAAGEKFQRDLFDAGLHIKTTGDAAILAPLE